MTTYETHDKLYHGRFRGGEIIEIQGEFGGTPRLLGRYDKQRGPHLQVQVLHPEPSEPFFTSDGSLSLHHAEMERPRRIGTVVLKKEIIKRREVDIVYAEHWATLKAVERAHERWKREGPRDLYVPPATLEHVTHTEAGPPKIDPRHAPFIREERSSKAEIEVLAGRMLICGWPTVEKNGREAVDAAWSIAYRAYDKPGFMHGCLNAMATAAQCGTVPPEHLATVEDRVNMLYYRTQPHGTQRTIDGSLWPIDASEDLGTVYGRQSLDMTAVEAALATLPPLITPLES
jgi:hypothetical protein